MMAFFRQPSIDERIPTKEPNAEKAQTNPKSQPGTLNVNSGGGTGEANAKHEEVTIDDEDCTVNVSSEGDDFVQELEKLVEEEEVFGKPKDTPSATTRNLQKKKAKLNLSSKVKLMNLDRAKLNQSLVQKRGLET